jgi:hypothetical protein
MTRGPGPGLGRSEARHDSDGRPRDAGPHSFRREHLGSEAEASAGLDALGGDPGGVVARRGGDGGADVFGLGYAAEGGQAGS